AWDGVQQIGQAHGRAGERAPRGVPGLHRGLGREEGRPRRDEGRPVRALGGAPQAGRRAPESCERGAGAHRLSDPKRFERYVAIGDSSTEGLLDVDASGRMRGWSFRLADQIARAQGGLLYANLAARGATTRDIAEHQLARAVAMKPDLVTVFS